MRALKALLVAALLVANSPLVPLVPGQDAPRRPLDVTGLDPDWPVAITAEVSAAKLSVRVVVKEGWHLYGRDVGGGLPVRIEVLEGSCVAAGGPPAIPATADGKLTGKVEIGLPLQRAAAGDSVRARFRFMACDALQCLAPAEVLLAGKVPADEAGPKVLLVAMANDERSARIAGFLSGRGFVPAVTTYEAVTLEECERHDVVIADSPYFEKARGARKHAIRFPETRSPMVAVGFLGTEVLEAQKVTMACGYI